MSSMDVVSHPSWLLKWKCVQSVLLLIQKYYKNGYRIQIFEFFSTIGHYRLWNSYDALKINV